MIEAAKVVDGWGPGGKIYQPTPEYQQRVRSLLNKFPYRLETNFSKLDRIVHPGIEAFKKRVLTEQTMQGRTIEIWNALLHSQDEAELIRTMQQILSLM